MKKSVIKGIFHGFRGHMETMNMPKDSQEKLGIVCDTYDELKEKISPELLNLHSKTCRCPRRELV